MIALHGVLKDDDGNGWRQGPVVLVDPAAVDAVVGREYKYHSFRPVQEYCLIYVRGNPSPIEVFESVGVVEVRLGLKREVFGGRA